MWDGEWIEGSGKSTGEETEQMFHWIHHPGVLHLNPFDGSRVHSTFYPSKNDNMSITFGRGFVTKLAFVLVVAHNLEVGKLLQ